MPSGSDEYDEQWEQALAAAPAAKSPMTRLLDMLAGWGQYADRDAFPDSAEAKDRIADLYQEAGNLDLKDTATAEENSARIRAFLVERVLPTFTM